MYVEAGPSNSRPDSSTAASDYLGGLPVAPFPPLSPFPASLPPATRTTGRASSIPRLRAGFYFLPTTSSGANDQD